MERDIFLFVYILAVLNNVHGGILFIRININEIVMMNREKKNR